MDSQFFRLAHAPLLYIAIPAILFCAAWVFFMRRSVIYNYSLATLLAAHNQVSTHPFRKILYVLRLLALLILAFLIGKPQLVDSRSTVLVEGIDIMLVIDASGSMEWRDYKDDQRSRFEVAQEEASRFIAKRDNDAMGIVLFGAFAISRCPLTMDKTILKTIVGQMQLGDVNPDGTALCTAIMNACNRLKNSQAKSKIMIVLTDGEPSQGDLPCDVAMETARQLGIKIYTIGIGNDEREFIRHPLYGVMEKPRINKPLLMKIARETGGKFFHARSAQDMRDVYNTIDTLEKTETETPIYQQYHDIFMPFLLSAIGLLAFELLAATCVWFTV